MLLPVRLEHSGWQIERYYSMRWAPPAGVRARARVSYYASYYTTVPFMDSDARYAGSRVRRAMGRENGLGSQVW
jgi:hypothetical protein